MAQGMHLHFKQTRTFLLAGRLPESNENSSQLIAGLHVRKVKLEVRHICIIIYFVDVMKLNHLILYAMNYFSDEKS